MKPEMAEGVFPGMGRDTWVEAHSARLPAIRLDQLCQTVIARGRTETGGTGARVVNRISYLEAGWRENLRRNDGHKQAGPKPDVEDMPRKTIPPRC